MSTPPLLGVCLRGYHSCPPFLTDAERGSSALGSDTEAHNKREDQTKDDKKKEDKRGDKKKEDKTKGQEMRQNKKREGKKKEDKKKEGEKREDEKRENKKKEEKKEDKKKEDKKTEDEKREYKKREDKTKEDNADNKQHGKQRECVCCVFMHVVMNACVSLAVHPAWLASWYCNRERLSVCVCVRLGVLGCGRYYER